MSELGRERFALTAPPPVRTLAIAALLAIIGVTLMVGSRAWSLGPVVLVLGIACLAFAIALALAGLILMNRLRSTLVLDDDGITVIRGRRTERLTWSDIDSVNLVGQRLTFHTKRTGRPRVTVINPGSGTDPTFTSLIRVIRGRLDASRGYRTS
ncbi:MAG TPA: hypothetical protein VNT27_09500 [Propionibacteriaceae bacterium]|nr:hypothetical protein [Propionibacteriaceae bacterium]